MLFLRSSLFLLFQAITLIPFALGCFLLLPAPFKLRYRFTVCWPHLLMLGAKYILGIKWEIKGQENIPEHAVVFLSKHQSAYETLLFPWFSPKPACFIYKKELNYIPFFGWGLASLRNIPINRADRKGAMQQVLDIGSQRIREGHSPVLFPEGTRIPVGQKGRYQSGGARLAVHAGATVIPVAHNAGEVWPRKAFIKKPGLVTFSFGPAISAEGMSHEELNRKVEAWIEGEMRVLSPHRYPAS
ncbi:MAG: 1-acyl-sn-glycerol-3-phosphate acyltransferase [Alcaligenaceae bacterium]|nr:1-acyl-sn-glycerol-3-phosphate acyltransferase [Alcaligenaceae bacterium]